jgi:RNA polymerase sigma factor (sigma-70 family)
MFYSLIPQFSKRHPKFFLDEKKSNFVHIHPHMIDRMPETDNDIIARFRVDREDAWRMIYERCHSTALRFMRSQFRSGVDFEDVFQDACIVLLKKIENPLFALNCSMQTYLNAVCRNILLRQYRRRPIQTSIDNEFELDLIFEVEMDEEENAYRQSIFLEVVELMRISANRCFEIFQLFYYREIGMQQIADRLGYSSAANVRQQKYKCLVKAKKEIERRLNLNSSSR